MNGSSPQFQAWTEPEEPEMKPSLEMEDAPRHPVGAQSGVAQSRKGACAVTVAETTARARACGLTDRALFGLSSRGRHSRTLNNASILGLLEEMVTPGLGWRK